LAYRVKLLSPRDLTPLKRHVEIFSSRSARTMLIHEDVSESSLQDQLILFRKSNTPDGKWTATRRKVPWRPGVAYGEAADLLGIDDTFLYHRFHDGAVIQGKLDELPGISER
jgi:hypothetical protein